MNDQKASPTRTTAELGRTRTERLANGLRVCVTPLPHLRSVSLSVAIAVGSRYETAADNGISHFLEHMLYRGTPRHPSAYDLNRAIEALGGDLAGATAADVTTFSLTLPPAALPEALDILAEVFRTPLLSPLEVEKQVVREEILEGLDESGNDVDPDDLSRGLLFGEHPLGFKIVGRQANLERFDEAELRAYLDRFYVGHNSVLAVAGPVQPSEVWRQADTSLGTLPAGTAQAAPPPPPVRAGPRTLHVEETGSQTSVRVAFPSFGERDPRTAALALASRILDDGMSARLHRALIDEGGLAYDAWAGLDLHVDCGVFDVSGTCAHAKAPRLLSEMLNVLGRLATEPVDERELEHARRRQLWSLEWSLDDAEEIAEHDAVATLFGLPVDVDELAQRIEAVTASDVTVAARAVLHPAGLHVVTVGLLDERLRADVDAVAHRWHLPT